MGKESRKIRVFVYNMDSMVTNFIIKIYLQLRDYFLTC